MTIELMLYLIGVIGYLKIFTFIICLIVIAIGVNTAVTCPADEVIPHNFTIDMGSGHQGDLGNMISEKEKELKRIKDCGKTKEQELHMKRFGICIALLLFFGLTWILLPTERTMYMMAGAHYLNKDNIPEKAYQLLGKKLNDLLKVGDK